MSHTPSEEGRSPHILQNAGLLRAPCCGCCLCPTGLREAEDSKALLRWGPTGHSLDTASAASGEAVGERDIRTEAHPLV